MADTTPRLKATAREKTGTRYAQRLRRTGKLPAVVYGHKIDPAHVAIDGHDLIHHLHHGAHVLEIEHETGNVETCLITDVQYDALGDTVIHVDLTRVDLTERVSVSVPLVVKGQDRSPGAKVPGAMVEQPMVDLEVECVVTNIPSQIIVDISAMELDDAIAVGDLQLPEGVSTEQNPEDIIVTIHLAKVAAEEEEEAEVEGEAASAEPEVITERKDEDEGEKEED